MQCFGAVVKVTYESANETGHGTTFPHDESSGKEIMLRSLRSTHYMFCPNKQLSTSNVSSQPVEKNGCTDVLL